MHRHGQSIENLLLDFFVGHRRHNISEPGTRIQDFINATGTCWYCSYPSLSVSVSKAHETNDWAFLAKGVIWRSQFDAARRVT
jgi:hypothetical protein